MEEARSRVLFMQHLTAQLSAKTTLHEFDLEQLALCARKCVELVALASLAANKFEYERARKKFSSDWNARLIFQDIERINRNFFPQPSEHVGSNIFKEPSYSCLTKESALNLYEQTSKFLHARNRYSPAINVCEDLLLLSERGVLLKNLLRSFEVHLLPEGFLYFVFIDFDDDRNAVQVHLAGPME